MADLERDAAPAVDHHHRAYQRAWLVSYWVSTALNVLFISLAVTADDVPGASYAALGIGALAALLGSILATALFRARVSSYDFDEATAPMRVLATGWVVLVCAMVVATLVGTGFGERDSAGPEATATVLAIADGVAAQVFGIAALFIVVGDSYTKTRRLLSERRAQPPPRPPAPPSRAGRGRGRTTSPPPAASRRRRR